MIEGVVSREALMIAYLDNFYLMFWLMIAITPMPLLARRARLPSAQKPSGPADQEKLSH
jgi:hypothetical protein